MKTFIATYLLDKEGDLSKTDKPMVEKIRDKIEYVFDKANDYERIKEKLPYPVDVVKYADTDYLMERIDNRELQSDILIVDVDMPKMSGLDIAKYIRQNKLDIIIIFLTGHDEYVYSSFEFAPLRYIRKEFIKEELLYALLAACRNVDTKRNEYVWIKTINGDYNVKTSEILYYEIENRRCNIYMSDGVVFSTKYKIKDIRKLIELKDDAFVQINSGCVVGIRHIKFMSKGDIGVKTDKILQIARRKKAEVEKIVLDYWGDKL